MACGKAIMHLCAVSAAGCYNYGPACPASSNCGSQTHGRDDVAYNVASKNCGPAFDGCQSGKLMSLSLEYTGRSAPGSFRQPNADWNHEQALFKGYLVKDNFPAPGHSTINKMQVLIKKFDMDLQSSLDEKNGKYYAQVGDIVNLFRVKANGTPNKLPATIKMKAGKTQIKFAASCKYAVRIGDEFGPFRVVGFTNTNPKFSCPWSEALRQTLRTADGGATATALANAAEEAPAAPASSASGSGDDSAQTAAIVLGVLGGVVMIAAAVVAIYGQLNKPTLMRPEAGNVPLHQPNPSAGAFEVDLEIQRMGRADSGEQEAE